VRSLNIDEPLARIAADGTVRFYHADALGSIIALTDANGAVRTRYNYSPYGVTQVIGEASENPFQFTARGKDETGLCYYRAGYYSPEMGGFISEDPIDILGGINYYAYTFNNPVNFVDPLGLYGTNDCSYYEKRCKEAGGEYYCTTIQYFCNKFAKYPDPDPKRDDDFEGWSRCTRQCLQDCDTALGEDSCEEPDPRTDSFFDEQHTYGHVMCYTWCGAEKVKHPLTP
jgi:RHS repeat-associated protein